MSSYTTLEKVRRTLVVTDSVDIDNLLEEEETTLAQTVKKYVPWLIVIGLAILFLPLYAISSTISADADRLNAELSNIQLTMVSEPTALPEVVTLEAEAATAQAQLTELEAVYTNLVDRQHIDWPVAVDTIRNYDAGRITLTSLEQVENRLMLRGQAVDDTAVINYARSLEDSGQFARVVVQSITLTTPQPTPTLAATATITPTATTAATATPAGGSGGGSDPQPGASPTTNPRDEYEVDDATAPPIFLGEAQFRNFYPTFDVDTAVFLAKAGRHYEVRTIGLAPGVDTYLTVTVGNTTLTNDDGQPGTLESKIGFQMAGDQDEAVMIQITNRGQYGPQMSYQLLVQEIVPTAVPTVASTSTPVPPTATSPPPTATTTSPSPTATATPDLRDTFEPDNTIPQAKPISVGQIQLHNFFPQGDKDIVSFLVKQDHHYQIATTGLALGVDTFMKVDYGVSSWENDDYDKPGSGNFASAVCFPAASDGSALATVSNLGLQFTPDHTYNITLAEVPELQSDAAQLTFGPVTTSDPNPPPQDIHLTGTNVVNWTAETEASWINLSAISGTTPFTLTVTVDKSGLPPGLHEDQITLAWATVCRRQIPVTLEVEAVSSNLPDAPDAPGAPLLVTSGEMDDTAVSHSRSLPAAKRNNQSGPVEFVIILELRTDEP